MTLDEIRAGLRAEVARRVGQLDSLRGALEMLDGVDASAGPAVAAPDPAAPDPAAPDPAAPVPAGGGGLPTASEVRRLAVEILTDGVALRTADVARELARRCGLGRDAGVIEQLRDRVATELSRTKQLENIASGRGKALWRRRREPERGAGAVVSLR